MMGLFAGAGAGTVLIYRLIDRFLRSVD
jgi:hypothetical protein